MEREGTTLRACGAPGQAERGAKLGLDRGAAEGAPDAEADGAWTDFKETTWPTLRSSATAFVTLEEEAAALVSPAKASARVAHVDESPKAKTPIVTACVRACFCHWMVYSLSCMSAKKDQKFNFYI